MKRKDRLIDGNPDLDFEYEDLFVVQDKRQSYYHRNKKRKKKKEEFVNLLILDEEKKKDINLNLEEDSIFDEGGDTVIEFDGETYNLDESQPVERSPIHISNFESPQRAVSISATVDIESAVVTGPVTRVTSPNSSQTKVEHESEVTTIFDYEEITQEINSKETKVSRDSIIDIIKNKFPENVKEQILNAIKVASTKSNFGMGYESVLTRLFSHDSETFPPYMPLFKLAHFFRGNTFIGLKRKISRWEMFFLIRTNCVMAKLLHISEYILKISSDDWNTFFSQLEISERFENANSFLKDDKPLLPGRTYKQYVFDLFQKYYYSSKEDVNRDIKWENQKNTDMNGKKHLESRIPNFETILRKEFLEKIGMKEVPLCDQCNTYFCIYYNSVKQLFWKGEYNDHLSCKDCGKKMFQKNSKGKFVPLASMYIFPLKRFQKSYTSSDKFYRETLLTQTSHFLTGNHDLNTCQRGLDIQRHCIKTFGKKAGKKIVHYLCRSNDGVNLKEELLPKNRKHWKKYLHVFADHMTDNYFPNLTNYLFIKDYEKSKYYEQLIGTTSYLHINVLATSISDTKAQQMNTETAGGGYTACNIRECKGVQRKNKNGRGVATMFIPQNELPDIRSYSSSLLHNHDDLGYHRTGKERNKKGKFISAFMLLFEEFSFEHHAVDEFHNLPAENKKFYDSHTEGEKKSLYRNVFRNVEGASWSDLNRKFLSVNKLSKFKNTWHCLYSKYFRFPLHSISTPTIDVLSFEKNAQRLTYLEQFHNYQKNKENLCVQNSGFMMKSLVYDGYKAERLWEEHVNGSSFGQNIHKELRESPMSIIVNGYQSKGTQQFEAGYADRKITYCNLLFQNVHDEKWKIFKDQIISNNRKKVFILPPEEKNVSVIYLSERICSCIHESLIESFVPNLEDEHDRQVVSLVLGLKKKNEFDEIVFVKNIFKFKAKYEVFSEEWNRVKKIERKNQYISYRLKSNLLEENFEIDDDDDMEESDDESGKIHDSNIGILKRVFALRFRKRMNNNQDKISTIGLMEIKKLPIVGYVQRRKISKKLQYAKTTRKYKYDNLKIVSNDENDMTIQYAFTTNFMKKIIAIDLSCSTQDYNIYCVTHNTDSNKLEECSYSSGQKLSLCIEDFYDRERN